MNCEGQFYEEASMFHGYMEPVLGSRFDVLLMTDDPVKAGDVWKRTTGLLDRLDHTFNLSGQEMEELQGVWKGYHGKTLGLTDLIQGKTDVSGSCLRGYAVSKVREMITCEGIADAFIDFGNDLICGIGKHPYGDSWKVDLASTAGHAPVIVASIPANAAVPQTAPDRKILAGFELRDETLSLSTGADDSKGKTTAVISPDPLDAAVLSTVWQIADASQQQEIAAGCPGTRTRTVLW